MAITDETIEYVAALAKLDLTDEERKSVPRRISAILSAMWIQ